MKIPLNKQQGFVLIIVMMISTFLIVMSGGLAALGVYQNKLYNQQTAKQEALHIAEAGINYYRWHLAHAQQDFMDGTGGSGPYIHNFTVPLSNVSGKFSLEITPPTVGSTIVKIKSTGWVDKYPTMKRSVEVRYGIPSLAHFSFLTNSNAWFGNTEHVSGELHSNGALRMDGTNDSMIISARATTTCTASMGCGDQTLCQAIPRCSWAASKCTCPGVFGTGTGTSMWRSPATAIDFNGITADISDLLDNATTSCSKFKVTGSNKGYHITFKADGTFDARVVNTLQGSLSQQNDNWNSPSWVNIAEQYQNQGAITNCAIPANGIIFIEDGDAWVDGVVNGRATLVAATLPDNASKRRSIIINDNITYLARDGSNILGLIAQKHIKVPRYAPTDLTIDAIMLAQNGRVFRNIYQDPNKLTKNSIEVYGGIISNLDWTWSWVNSGGVIIDGYINTQSIYDANVTYSPPPSFPTTGEYAFISWQER